MSKYHLSRSQRGAWAADNPIGDPFGGPAYGERLDVGGIAGGLFGGNSADKAASAQAGAVQAANQLSENQFRQIQEQNRPFIGAGTQANNQLAAYLGLDIPAYSRAEVETMLRNQGYGNVTGKSGKQYFVQSRLNNAVEQYLTQQQKQQNVLNAARQSGQFGSLNKPFGQSDLDNDVIYQNTYQTALDQGNLGVNRLAAATGSQLSGATLKALQKKGADTAASYGNDAFNRWNVQNTNTYNRLAGVSGAGQQAVNTVAKAGQNYANNVGDNLVGMGNVRGASAIAEGKAYGGVGNILGNAFGKSSIGKSALSIFGL